MRSTKQDRGCRGYARISTSEVIWHIRAYPRHPRLDGFLTARRAQKNGGTRGEFPRFASTSRFACHAARGTVRYFFFSTLNSPFFQASSLKTRLSWSSPVAFSTLPLHMPQQNWTLAPPTVSSFVASTSLPV